MSFNQSRSDKSETTQHRKSGRSSGFNQPRSYGEGGGGGPASSPSSSSSSNRRFKKSNNVQGGQSRVYSSAVKSSGSSSASSAAHHNLQNGAHAQPSLHGGASDAPVASSAPRVIEAPAAQRSTPAIPKARVSQPAAMSSDTAGQSATVTTDTSAPKTPAKGPADASKGYAFQFGSLSPGFMNGMQIPARTFSAPPNLDEQKRNQAHPDAYRAVPSLPMAAPKQQIPSKDMSIADQSNIGETHLPKPKKDSPVSVALPVSQMQKPSIHSISISSMQVPYHPSQVSVPFGGPNPQIQSQGVTASSLQMGMPMALPLGNAPQIQQPMYIQGLPPPPMQPQGIMHQAQSISFPNQMGPHLPPQLGNLGMSITSQYPQQQGGKFSGAHKTPVKITDPKTHEELRLDKRADACGDSQTSGLRSHTNVPPQSQPVQFAPTNSSNYFPNSHCAGNLYFQPPSSPVASCQMAPNSQLSIFNHPADQSPQTSVRTSVINSMPANKTETVSHSVAEPTSSNSLCDRHNTISFTSSGTVTVKPTAGSTAQKAVEPPSSSSSSFLEKGGSHKSSRPSGEVSLSHSQRDAESLSESSLQQPMPDNETSASKSAPVATKQPMAVSDSEGSGAFSATLLAQSEESLSLATNTDSGKKEALSRSNSMKDHQKKITRKVNDQFQHQIAGQPTSVLSLPSYGLEHGSSSGSGTSETVESKKALASVIDGVSTKFVGVSVMMVSTSPSDASMSTVDNTGDTFTDVSSERTDVGAIAGSPDTSHHRKLDDSSALEPLKNDTLAMKEQGQIGLPENSKQDDNSSEICTAHHASESDPVKQAAEKSALTATAFGNEVQTLETAEVRLNEPVTCHMENNRILYNMISTNSDSGGVAKTIDNHTLAMDAPLSTGSDACNEESSGNKFSALTQQSDPLRSCNLSVTMSKHEAESVVNVIGSFSSAVPSSKEKPVELTMSKSCNSRMKKKWKEILQKADAAGTTSDLYMAYKGPEEKKENAISTEVGENISTGSSLKPLDGRQGTSPLNAEDGQNMVEPDDWEDAADISAPKLQTPNILEQAHGGPVQHDKNGNANTAKKYSRDFLLKFTEQCTGLPEGFEITTVIADALISVNISHPVDRDLHPSRGRVIDRSNSGPRLDRRGSGIFDDDRWSKLSPYGMGREMHVDIGYGGNIGFRPGQGGNFGVLRNPRAQSSVVYMGGILTGPMQSMGPQAEMQRNGPAADRWLRATNIQQKGLIPSPQTPLPMMHKAERKYEVGKVTDVEQAKQRQLKAILNKLTPQNFEKLFEQVKAVNIDNTGTLNDVISQIFDKALMEPTFCEMYANFCYHLAGELPDFSEDNEKITFKRLLLNKCQEEFERGEREQEEANEADEEGEAKQSEGEREEKRLEARRRMLGNIRLIGELYKKKMLTEKIMHICIQKLLGQDHSPDEEDIEALCKLMSTIGVLIDHPKAKEHMDAYFDIMMMLSNNMKLSSRVRFMLKDAIDLRKNKWQQRRKVEGPKKIEEVHRDAAHERQQQASRLARNPSISSGRRAPIDFGPRGSAMLSSPSAQTGGFRGLPTQAHGFGTQDVRFGDRQPYEARTLSVSLPQRPLGDDSITLGPQGGLARGMSIRGPPTITSATIVDIASSQGDSRRTMPGLNGLSNVSERPIYGVQDDLVPRVVPDRFTGPAAYDQLGSQERNISLINRDPRNVDRRFDRHLATSPPALSQGPALTQNVPSEKVWPEECLRDMSMAAIKEFYSARDEKEVALCIKDLNSSHFHPSMVCLWITDSFERKDIERDLLAKLLVNLTRSQEGILTPVQLIKGFESVLTTLEDAINDAPKAAEFLGRIFAKVVLDNVVSLGEISRLLHEGGEEPGRPLEVGLAGDVLGSTLEMIKAEKGEKVLNDVRNSSNLRSEDFRPPDPNRSGILEKFI